MRAAIVRHPIDLPSLVAEVSGPANGAVVTFAGTVRAENDGRPVNGIEYSAYDEMAVSEIAAILSEARVRFGIEQAAVEHRVGSLGIGDTSIAVAVAAPHRAAAFDAARYIVDQAKQRAPVWKLELYADGTREWVGSAASTAGTPK